MKTVRTIEGAHIVLAEVQAYRDEEDGTVEVSLRGGGRHSVSREEWSIRADYEHVVPAQPGTYLLSRLVDENGTTQGYAKEAVLAWAVSPNGAEPVTLDGVDKKCRAVLMPDGRVEEPVVGSTYEDLGQFVQEMMREQTFASAPASASRH